MGQKKVQALGEPQSVVPVEPMTGRNPRPHREEIDGKPQPPHREEIIDGTPQPPSHRRRKSRRL